MRVLESILHSTTRIVGHTKTGEVITGTGFFFHMHGIMPALITNKHVIDSIEFGHFFVSDRKNMDEAPNIGRLKKISFFFKKSDGHFKYHPDPNVDLCAIQIGSFLNAAKRLGNSPLISVMNAKNIPSPEEINRFEAIEDIFMVGYPNGIWDEHNNMPLVRKGITATSFSLNYNGKSEFLIDAACFPGSSGSPVIIYKQGILDPNGNFFYKPVVFLLGVLYAGPQHTAKGAVEIVRIPTINLESTILVPNNLGVVIKSEKIFELEQLFKPDEGMPIITDQLKVLEMVGESLKKQSKGPKTE